MTHSNDFSKNNTADVLSVTLDLDSISRDGALSPYWSERCEENQSNWWLPHQIASQGRDSQSSNYQEVQSSFWKKTIQPISSMYPISYPISLPSATPFMESVIVKGTKKIRVYPKNKRYLLEVIRQQRRAYNLAIACFVEQDEHVDLRNDSSYDKSHLRKTIREFVKSEVEERGEKFLSAGCDEAVASAFLTKDAVIRNRTQGKKSGFSFKAAKNPRQSLIWQKLSKGFIEKQFYITEDCPEESLGKQARVIYDKGRWFLLAQKQMRTVGQSETQAQNIVAIDPGVRTFATAYSSHESVSYGDQFFEERVMPLLLKMDNLYSLKSKAKNYQWKRHYEKRIHRLSNRVRDRIDDLHRRVCYDLVSSYDIILLPSFETSQMSKKSGRKIRSKTVRAMLGLGHYRFKQMLYWMCKKYGKRLVIVNESYTSKTRSWDGSVKNNLGGSKTISDGSITVDRDINGARGIMLRALYGTHTVSR